MTAPAESRSSWALAACARVMRPVVRLALAMGLKHAQLQTVLRELLIDEARRSWRRQGVEANISQVSVTTGLNRKAVTSQLRAPDAALAQTERSAAAKTLTLWLQLAGDDPAWRVLPIGAEHGPLSFEVVARDASRGNLHHRVILEELLRLHLVRLTDDGQVELAADGFVPAHDVQSMLAFLGDNARDHLLAAVSNTLGEAPPMLERSVYAQGLTLADCEQTQQQLRKRWSGLQRELTRELGTAVNRADATGGARIRIGIYAFHEDTADDAGAIPPTRSTRTTRTTRTTRRNEPPESMR